MAGCSLPFAGAGRYKGKSAIWKVISRVRVEPAGTDARVVVDVTLTPSAAIPDERAVAFGPPGLRRFRVGMPAGTAALLSSQKAQPPSKDWVLLAQGAAGGLTDPTHPLRLHNQFTVPSLDSTARTSVERLLGQSRIVLVWGDRKAQAIVLQWFYEGGKRPQPPVAGSFGR